VLFLFVRAARFFDSYTHAHTHAEERKTSRAEITRGASSWFLLLCTRARRERERESFFQNSFGEKKPRPRGIRKSHERARGFSLSLSLSLRERHIKRKSPREEEVSSREKQRKKTPARDGSIVRDGREILALSLHLGKHQWPRSGRARRKRIDVSISLVDRRLRLGVNRGGHWRRVRLAKVSEWEL
jgi:hypothetical protein